MEKIKVAQRVAQLLLQVKIGEQLPPIRELARTLDVSIGAISEALGEIEHKRAIKLERRGRLGLLLLDRDIGKLWSIAEAKPLIIAFPLVTTSRIEGLATAAKKLFTDIGIDVFIIYMRGARQRLHALKNGTCHLAVMSGLAASNLCSHTENVILKLPFRSYISEHRVYYYKCEYSGLDNILRVAFDPDSIDQQKLSKMEFLNQKVEWVQVNYTQFTRYLLNRDVDAAIWTSDEIYQRNIPDLLNRPLSEKTILQISDEDTRATFVSIANNESVRVVAQEILIADYLIKIQMDVMSGQMVPEY